MARKSFNFVLLCFVGTVLGFPTFPRMCPSSVAGAQEVTPAISGLEQDASVQEIAPTTRDLPEDDPNFDHAGEAKKFEDLLTTWKQTILDLNEVTIRYRNSQESEGAALRAKHRELEVKGRVEFDEAFRQALLLCENAPRKSFAAAEFLLIGMRYRHARGWHEFTGEAAECLLRISDGGRGLPEIAGVSFYATNQFEKARQHLAEAVAMGLLDRKNFGLLEVIDLMVEPWQKEEKLRQADVEKGDLPQVKLTTSRGEVVLELFEDQAPNTVANFIQLVEEGAYRGIPFYQVLEGQIALAGDVRVSPLSAGFRIEDENDHKDARPVLRGSIAMAKIPMPEGSPIKTVPDSANSHFFISFQPLPQASDEHTVFGRIIQGIEHFSALTRVDPSKKEDEDSGPALNPDLILEAEVIRRRDHEYKPVRIEVESPETTP
jgi:cyclophilin family peptidyl-prolyl cis-trans isomerase